MDSIEKQKSIGNPLGWTGLVLAMLGLIAFLVTIGWIEQIQRDTNWDMRGEGIARIGQGLILLSGCLVGGVLNLVSLILSLIGFRRRPRWPAGIGAVFSVCGPLIVIGWWVFVVESR